MERLTDRDIDGCLIHPWSFNGINGSYDIWDEDLLEKEIDRLAAYEDTGIDPDELRIIGDIKRFKNEIIFGSKADRLKELSDADNAGRLIVLPCKVGDTVWVVFSNGLRPYVVDRLYVMADSKVMVRMRHMLTEILRVSEDNFGKTVFLTQKEAEMALKGEHDG